MNANKQSKLKTLSTSLTPGSPLTSEDLAALGISADLAVYYVRTGWLKRVARGIFCHPSHDLELHPCLRLLQRKIPGHHVGGKTALEWHGIRHYLLPKPVVMLYGLNSGSLPDWFVQRFAAQYHRKRLFDEEQQYYPGLGFCKASNSLSGGHVTVECIKAGAQPSVVSAEIPGVSATRVDSGPVNYRPKQLEFLSVKKYKLVVNSVDLFEVPEVLVTAYNQNRFLRKLATSDGVIGSMQNECALPQKDQLIASADKTWSDSSSHQAHMITVDENAQVEVLDWGYHGEARNPRTLVLLAGLGATAHIYDDIAPDLSTDYRVIGITRRGFGNSSKTDSGYQISQLAGDILGSLEILGINNYVLVGHSIAGEELNFIANTRPDGLEALVYLDAAYDRSETDASAILPLELRLALPPTPPPTPADFATYHQALQYLASIGIRGEPPEGEFLASFDLRSGRRTTDPLVAGAITHRLNPPKYEDIDVPALGLFAMPSSAQALMRPWYDGRDPKTREAVDTMYEAEVERKGEQIGRFSKGVSNSKVRVLYDAGHSLFLSNEEEVLIEIRDFLESI